MHCPLQQLIKLLKVGHFPQLFLFSGLCFFSIHLSHLLLLGKQVVNSLFELFFAFETVDEVLPFIDFMIDNIFSGFTFPLNSLSCLGLLIVLFALPPDKGFFCLLHSFFL